MAQFVNMFPVDLANGPALKTLNQMHGSNAMANRIGAIVTDNGTPVALTGTCSGTVILSDHTTVALTGTISGNQAYVILSSDCYAVEGPIHVFVTVTSNSVSTTLVAASGYVRATETDTIIDPGTIIPSVSALIAQIETAVASIPADYSTLLASIAPTFSASNNYVIGNYVWYNGNLYRFNANHSAGAWIGTDAARYTSTDEYALLRQTFSASINELRESFRETFDQVEHPAGDNLLNPDNVSSGYVWTDGHHESTSYINTGKIRVTAGKTYSNQVGDEPDAVNRQKTEFRFVVFYGEDGNTVVGSASNVTDILVPDNAYYLVGSANYTSVSGFLNVLPCFVEGTTLVDYEPYQEAYTSNVLKAECNNTPYILSLIHQQMAKAQGKAVFSATAASLAANTNLVCCEACDNKKNEYIELMAQFTTFGSLTIAHGKGSYGGGYLVVTGSKIQIYNYDGTLLEEYTHGLTLSSFIYVCVYTKNDASCRSRISLMTVGGDYTVETSRYYGCRAAVLCNATFAMTNVTMQYTVNDAKESVWVFGDSYLSLGDPNRWATQMVTDGYANALLSGFGGATSTNEIASFRTLMEIAKPDFVVWCLGMNDGDSGAVNASWKVCVDEVIAACEAENVTPILATIPNIPSVDHTYKNAYVKSLGYRYADFAKAVNAESAGAFWYAGMLSTDNVHPTALGAKALMRQFLLDVPEVLYDDWDEAKVATVAETKAYLGIE